MCAGRRKFDVCRTPQVHNLGPHDYDLSATCRACGHTSCPHVCMRSDGTPARQVDQDAGDCNNFELTDHKISNSACPTSIRPQRAPRPMCH